MKDSNPTSPTTRCEPPPEHQAKRWHWIDTINFRDGSHVVNVAGWVSGRWLRAGRSGPLLPDIAWQHGWRYLEPCIRQAAGQTSIEAAMEIFRLAFPDAHEQTHDDRLRLVIEAMLECKVLAHEYVEAKVASIMGRKLMSARHGR